MARQRRAFAAAQTYFVLAEGHDGNHCFHDDACYRHYLARLGSALPGCQIRLHAYALLPNEIQLLLTPCTPAGISQLMRLVGSGYAQYFNHRFERSGALWKGRFKSSRVAETMLADCQKYVELAPVRARLVEHPGVHPWSSYTNHGFGGTGHLLTPHDAYLRQFRRRGSDLSAYRGFIAAGFSEGEWRELDRILRFGHPLAPVNAASKWMIEPQLCGYNPALNPWQTSHPPAP